MRTAIVCWRPYQLFNAIRFLKSEQDIAKDIIDLFIVDIPAVHELITRIKDESCFSSVNVFIELEGKNRINRIKRTMGFLFPKAMLKKHLRDSKSKSLRYDRVVATGWNHYFIDLCEINPNAEIILLEDGTITYIGDERLQPYNYKKYKRLLMLTGKGPLSIDVACLYINNKDMLTVKYDYPVLNMPKIDDDCFLLLSRIFGYCKPCVYNENKTVYLTQPLSEQFVNKAINKNEILKIISANRKDLIVRKHPAEKMEMLDVCQDDSGCSWELLARSIDDSWTLIGVFSSAQLMPTILYGTSPNLVFLHRIVLKHDTDRYREIDDFIVSFIEKYKGKSYIPNSLNELRDYLSDI